MTAPVFKFLPLPARTLNPAEDNAELTAIPMMAGELRELHFPTGALERFYVGRIVCDGRTVTGRMGRRGVFFLSAPFKIGSRLTVTLSNLLDAPASTLGFSFGVHVEQAELERFERELGKS